MKYYLNIIRKITPNILIQGLIISALILTPILSIPLIYGASMIESIYIIGLLFMFLYPFFGISRLFGIPTRRINGKLSHYDAVFDIIGVLFIGAIFLILESKETLNLLPIIEDDLIARSYIQISFILSSICYITTIYKKRKLHIIIEILNDIILLNGIILNILITTTHPYLGLLINVWFALFYISAYLKNQTNIMNYLKTKFL